MKERWKRRTRCGDERLFVSVGGSPEGQSRGWFVRGASKSGVVQRCSSVVMGRAKLMQR